MKSSTIRRLAAGIAAAVALPLFAACSVASDSANDSSTSTSTSTSAADTGTSDTGTSATDSTASPETSAPTGELAYDGPEADLPNAYPEPTVKEGFEFTIGWLVPNLSIPSLRSITDGIEAEAERLGGKVIVLDSQFNPQTEVNNFNQLLAQDVDAIVSFPLNPGALAPSLEAAAAKGVPVISIDAPASATAPLIEGYVSNIILSRDRGTSALAQTAAAQAPGAQFALLGNAKPVPTLQYVMERNKHWAEENGLVFAGQIDAQQDSSEGAAQAMAGILAKYPDVKVVFTYNDVSAIGAAAQTKVSGRDDVLVFGFNGEAQAVTAVENGDLAGTYQIPFEEVGSQVVIGLYNVLTEQNVPIPERVALPGTLIVP